MPENISKIPRSLSPVVRSGAGDISERELSRERYTLQTTPTARLQPAHPKKQLFSAPVNKFTASKCCASPNENLVRIKSCLDQMRIGIPAPRPAYIGSKALSMEDLTPTKSNRRELKPRIACGLEQSKDAENNAAAAKVARFVLLASWRRRRAEAICLRKTLECQVSCSERLRLQVAALKSLLDSDNAKVRLAIKEVERLKQLLHEKDIEKALLEKEKIALENDVCTAEDRASEISIGWRNTRNELEIVKTNAAITQRAYTAANSAQEQANRMIKALEEQISQLGIQFSASQAEMALLAQDHRHGQIALSEAEEIIADQKQKIAIISVDRDDLLMSLVSCEEKKSELSADYNHVHEQLVCLTNELNEARERLSWWPAPLTSMMGVVNHIVRSPRAIPKAILWSLLPSRYGC